MKIFEFTENGFVTTDSNSGQNCWFVMQVSSNKAVKTKEFLEQNSIDCIVPMQYQEVIKRGKKCRELVSACDNEVFIYTNKEQLRWIKKHLPYLTYVKIAYNNDKFEKMIVSIDKDEAKLFKVINEHYLDSVVIVDDEDVNWSDFVSIVPKSGILKGEPLFVVDVKGYGKCAVATLCSDIVIAITSPASKLTVV